VGGQNLRTIIGVISGTSMDGIDVALLRTDGVHAVETGLGRVLPYPAELRAELRAFLAQPDVAERDPLHGLEARVTAMFAEAIESFLRLEHLKASDIDLVGCHGQTVYHRPEKRFTRQLCDGAALAQRLGIAVADDFRTADVKAGGQGAPLVPLYHAALASDLPGPLVVLNLGGVANITYIGRDRRLLAFDTGPASAMIDDLMLRHFGKPYDDNGSVARNGKVDQTVLATLLANPFFDAPPPKSLDRQDFHHRAAAANALAPADAVATLTAFTVEATVKALAHVPEPPLRWLVTGGGRHNSAFMQQFAARLGVPVEPVEVVGWNGDMLEAECFAYLAARVMDGLPLSLPETTGVPHPQAGGRLHRPI
jgi:anhydro-N-acetylmuramic acid kinase